MERDQAVANLRAALDRGLPITAEDLIEGLARHGWRWEDLVWCVERLARRRKIQGIDRAPGSYHPD